MPPESQHTGAFTINTLSTKFYRAIYGRNVKGINAPKPTRKQSANLCGTANGAVILGIANPLGNNKILTAVIDEEGEKIYNMDLIPSIGLVEELMGYSRDGNFDRVMAFFQLMLVVEEYKEEEVTISTTNTIAEQLLNR